MILLYTSRKCPSKLVLPATLEIGTRASTWAGNAMSTTVMAAALLSGIFARYPCAGEGLEAWISEYACRESSDRFWRPSCSRTGWHVLKKYPTGPDIKDFYDGGIRHENTLLASKSIGAYEGGSAGQDHPPQGLHELEDVDLEINPLNIYTRMVRARTLSSRLISVYTMLLALF